MVLLAKRVSASRCAPNKASTPFTPSDFAACSTTPNSSRHRSMVNTWASTSAGISGPDLDVVESGWARSVAGADHLFRLSLAAVGHAPQRPMISSGDGRAGVPELGGDTAVGRILQHAHALAVAKLPRDFAAELEVVALVVDGPAPVGLHVDRLARAAQH